MAQRRMFSLKVIDTDSFLDMSPTAQLLYFHLSMRADDDGFVSSPKKIMKMANAADDDMRVLIAKKYLIPFDTGVCVIRDWKIHNYIQSDRYAETEYKDEKAQLVEKHGKYDLDTDSIQNVSNMDTQVRLGKDRIGKVRKDIVAKPPDEVNILLDFFKNTVNEHISFGNKTERKACADLLKTYGLEKTQAALLFVEEKRKSDRYLPVVTTPYELWTKWAKIKQHLTTEQTTKKGTLIL